MKLSKILTALFLTVCMLTSVVSAAVIDSAVYNPDTDTITIKGQIPQSEVLATKNLTNDVKTSAQTSIVENAWAVSGTWVTGTGDVYKLEKLNDDPTNCPNGYVKVSERPNYYTTPVQRIHTFLNENGLGKYEIEGKIKTSSSTAQTIVLHLVKDFTTGLNHFDDNYHMVKIYDVADEWVSFKAEFDINTYGVKTDGTAWEHFPSTTEGNGTKAVPRNCSIDFYTDSTSSAKLADLYVADVKISRVIDYEIPDKIGVTVSNDTGVVYANEITLKEEGGYEAALQLKDGTSLDNLTAKVYNPASKKATTENIIRSSERNGVAIKTDNLVQVSFDIFDYVDTRNINSLSIIAANYDANDILINTIVTPLDITHSTLVNQNVSVGGNASKTKLFLFENTTTIIPLADADVFTSYEEAESKLFLIGDSICVEYKTDNYYPQQGWGVKFADLFEGIEVVNCAHGGYSTETFFNYETYQRAYGGAHSWNGDKVVTSTGALTSAEKILPQIKKGDYVLVSLGINDGFSVDFSDVADLNAGQTTAEKYKANLQKFIDDTKAKGAEIIFATPTANGTKNKDTGIYDEDYKQRGDLMTEVANANGIVCLPLGKTQAERYNTMNETDVKKLHMFKETYGPLLKELPEGVKHSNKSVQNGVDDTVHLTEDGAQFIAELIAEMLASSDSSLKYYLK